MSSEDLCPALVRLEQYGWIKGPWGGTERAIEKPSYYAIMKVREKFLDDEIQRWHKMAGLVERLSVEEV